MGQCHWRRTKQILDSCGAEVGTPDRIVDAVRDRRPRLQRCRHRLVNPRDGLVVTLRCARIVTRHLGKHPLLSDCPWPRYGMTKGVFGVTSSRVPTTRPMIFVLPFIAQALHLSAGVGGAWIGTSEFADAAGFAAAQTYGNLASHGAVTGTSDQAIFAYTLIKVVGRDVWIGIWAFILAVIATTQWERAQSGRKPEAAEIWWRFPKFVIGFLVTSLLVTAVTTGYTLADYNKNVVPSLVAPIKDLRTWAFIFCFLSIGLTTRFRELVSVGKKPFLAFSAGAIVNVVIGFILSAIVFASHWNNLAP
jgi:Conserved hypothetical protein 698